MPKYIHSGNFARRVCNFQGIDEHSANAVVRLLYTEPEADVVEVVRCGECKHFGCRSKGILGEDVGYCYNNENNGFPFSCDSRPCMRATDFCSYGEREDSNDL